MPLNNQIKLHLPNLESTKKFGQIIGQIIQPNTILALSGEIGSGKTTLVKAIAKTLAIQETVTSPTFVMMNEYHSGRLPLYHIDLYRLMDQSSENISFDLLAPQLEEVVNTESLIIIEWAEIFSSHYGQDLNKICENGILSLNLSPEINNNESRILTMTTIGQNKKENKNTASILFQELCQLSKNILIQK